MVCRCGGQSLVWGFPTLRKQHHQHTSTGRTDQNGADLLDSLLLGAGTKLLGLESLDSALQVGNDALETLDLVVDVSHLVGVAGPVSVTG